jgi:hypothetical protein
MVLTGTAVAFCLLLAAILVSQKHGWSSAMRLFTIAWFALAIPLALCFTRDIVIRAPTRNMVAFALVFAYMAVEFLLDIVLKVDFRSRWATHAPYILLEYAALYSLVVLARGISTGARYLAWGGVWVVMLAVVYVYAVRLPRPG